METPKTDKNQIRSYTVATALDRDRLTRQYNGGGYSSNSGVPSLKVRWGGLCLKYPRGPLLEHSFRAPILKSNFIGCGSTLP